jgi:hypothetical protein
LHSYIHAYFVLISPHRRRLCGATGAPVSAQFLQRGLSPHITRKKRLRLGLCHRLYCMGSSQRSSRSPSCIDAGVGQGRGREGHSTPTFESRSAPMTTYTFVAELPLVGQLRCIQTSYNVVLIHHNDFKLSIHCTRRRTTSQSSFRLRTTSYDVAVGGVLRRRTASYVHVNCMLMPRSLCPIMNIHEKKYRLPLAESLRRRTTSCDMICRPASKSTDDVVLIKTVLISA